MISTFAETVDDSGSPLTKELAAAELLAGCSMLTGAQCVVGANHEQRMVQIHEWECTPVHAETTPVPFLKKQVKKAPPALLY